MEGNGLFQAGIKSLFNCNDIFLGIIYLGGKLIDRLYQVFYSIGKDQEASKWRKHQDSRTARA